MMKPLTKGMEIRIYFDTNSLGRYDSGLLKCDRFPESKVFSNLICFMKTHVLEDIKICFPEVVIREIMHQMVDSCKRMTQSYKDCYVNHKKILGEIIKKEPEFIFEDDSENVMFAILETKRFLKRYSKYVKVIKHSNSIFPILLTKALYKVPPFSSLKVSGKEYTDVGFKDAVIWETLLQEASNSNIFIFFFSIDGDFANASPAKLKDRLLVCSDYNELAEKLKELYGLSEIVKIVQKFKTDDYLWSSILEYVQLKGKCDLTSVKILSADLNHNTDDSDDDSENESDSTIERNEDIYMIKASILIDKIPYCFFVKYDCSANVITNVEMDKEGE